MKTEIYAIDHYGEKLVLSLEETPPDFQPQVGHTLYIRHYGYVTISKAVWGIGSDLDRKIYFND